MPCLDRKKKKKRGARKNTVGVISSSLGAGSLFEHRTLLMENPLRLARKENHANQTLNQARQASLQRDTLGAVRCIDLAGHSFDVLVFNQYLLILLQFAGLDIKQLSAFEYHITGKNRK